MFHHPFSAYAHPHLSLYRRARGGGIRGGGVVFDTEPRVLPITLQQLESQSMRGVREREEEETTERGTKEREKDESLTCGRLMKKPLTQEFLVFSK